MLTAAALTEVGGIAAVTIAITTAVILVGAKFGLIRPQQLEATDSIWKAAAEAWKGQAEGLAAKVAELEAHAERMDARVDTMKRKLDEQDAIITELRARPDLTVVIAAVGALQEHLLERFTTLEVVVDEIKTAVTAPPVIPER